MEPVGLGLGAAGRRIRHRMPVGQDSGHACLSACLPVAWTMHSKEDNDRRLLSPPRRAVHMYAAIRSTVLVKAQERGPYEEIWEESE